jgi:6-phosphogluconolactonase (cycloisomerase 2 family)
MISVIVSLLGSIQLSVATDFVTLYVGSYSSNIARISLSAEGQLKYIGESVSELNPSWLTFNPSGHLLFAVSEVGDYPNPDYAYSGGMSSFAVEVDGSLRPLSTVASGGSSPAHSAIDASGETLYISNYCAGMCLFYINTSILKTPTCFDIVGTPPRLNRRGSS